MRSFVISIFLYACKSWTHTAELQRRIRAMEARCYRKILHISQRPSYQRGGPCQEMQTAVVWTRLPFVRSGQNQLASHSERGKKTRPTEEEVGRQHQGMDRPGVCQVHRAVENRKMEETGSEVICGAPATLAAKE